MSYSILAQAIRDTLLENESLALPGLGWVSTRSYPARLVRTESRLYPPRKSPVFEAKLEGEQGMALLVARYARLSGLSSYEAERQVAEDLLELREDLLQGKDVALSEVGRFYINERGETAFVPASFNYNLDMYGLAPVTARPVIKRTAAEAAAEAIQARNPGPIAVPVARKWRGRDQWFLTVMGVLLLAAIAVAIWLIYAPAIRQQAPTLVEQTYEDEEEVTESYTIEEETLRNGSDIVEITDEEDDEEEEREVEVPPVVSDGTKRSQDRLDSWTHTIIVGHFGDPQNVANALRRIEAMGMQGDSRLTDAGLTRVMVRVHADHEDPDEVLTLIRDVFEPKAWIQARR